MRVSLARAAGPCLAFLGGDHLTGVRGAGLTDEHILVGVGVILCNRRQLAGVYWWALPASPMSLPASATPTAPTSSPPGLQGLLHSLSPDVFGGIVVVCSVCLLVQMCVFIVVRLVDLVLF